MFYDKFKQLCDQKGVSAKRAVTEMGMSNSLATKWKNTEATPNSTTLKKVADYFGVSVSYLLGTEEKPAATEGNGLSAKEIVINKLQQMERDDLWEVFDMLAKQLKE